MRFKEKVDTPLGRAFRFLARWLKRLCIAIGGIVLAILVVGLVVGGFAAHYVFYNRDNLPDLQLFIDFDVPQIGLIYDINGKPIINLAKEYRLILKPDEITPLIKSAILSAEDKNFYQHNGVDWTALLIRAVGKNLSSSVEISIKERRPRVVFRQGASTITDQLVGLYYKDRISNSANKLSESWWGFVPNKFLKKAEELRLAIWLEEEIQKSQYFGSKLQAKNEILARFLSYVYFRKTYGIKAAALYYFGKDLADLNYGETALLAGIIKNPGLYSPTQNPPNNLFVQRQVSRRNNILDLMAENGYLTQKQADNFKENKLPVPVDKRDHTEAPTVVGDILTELKSAEINLDELFNGTLKVYSTVNLEIQLIANQALENGVEEFEKRHLEGGGLVQGSVVVLQNGDAAVLAEVGGRKVFKDRPLLYSDFNRVRHSYRQPGSAFKPLVYLTALKYSFWSLDDKVIDKPISVSMGWNKPRKWISNYDNKFKGLIPMRRALAESRNAATIWVVKRMGSIEKTIEIAHVLGIKTKLQPYITTALGASEVNLLELANAYRAIASGMTAEPYVIEKVVGQNGQDLFRHSNVTHPLSIDKRVLELIQEGLRGNVLIPGATAYGLTATQFPVPLMGKTGTTNDFRDALFFCSTYGPQGITVAVRIGYDDNRSLGDKETGARAALPICKEIVGNIYAQGLAGPIPKFPDHIEENIRNYMKTPQ